MNSNEIIADLLECMKAAINSGDWKVDGACDPDSSIRFAEQYLKRNGWGRNSIDNQWVDSEYDEEARLDRRDRARDMQRELNKGRLS